MKLAITSDLTAKAIIALLFPFAILLYLTFGFWSVRLIQADGYWIVACPQCELTGSSTVLLKDGSLKKVVSIGKINHVEKKITKAFLVDYEQSEVIQNKWIEAPESQIQARVFYVFSKAE